MRNLITVFIMFSMLLFGESFEEYKQKNQQEFGQYKKKLEEDFKNYQAIYKKELKKFKQEIYSNWGDRKTSSKSKWIEYAQNKRVRKIVDFDKNEIVIEVISDKNSKIVNKLLYREAIKTIISSSKDAKEKDVLTKRVDEKFKKIAKTEFKKDKGSDRDSILQNAIFQKPASIGQIVKYVKKEKTKTFIKPSKIPHNKVYSIRIKLPKYFPLKKAEQLKSKVAKYSKKFKIERALIYAIMHSESNFNPLSTSHVPAYGLMQIVPRTAGLDAYQMVYKKRRMLSASYLYNSKNNIEMGSAYLHILYYRYLKRVTNPESRMYCVIAGYNTGAGNVSRAFAGGSRKGRLKRAIKVINQMSPKQVYNTLIHKLPHDETKVYLKRVTKRVGIYRNLGI